MSKASVCSHPDLDIWNDLELLEDEKRDAALAKLRLYSKGILVDHEGTGSTVVLNSASSDDVWIQFYAALWERELAERIPLPVPSSFESCAVYDAMVPMASLALGAAASSRHKSQVTAETFIANANRYIQKEGPYTRAGYDIRYPKAVRRLLAFRWQAFLFATAVFAAGGLPLTQRMLAHAPKTSADIIHPEKYTHGWMPILITLPSLPRWTVSRTTSLGELGAELALEPTREKNDDLTLAQGWRGDSYTSLQDAARNRAIVWVTAWDTAENARVFRERFKQRWWDTPDITLESRERLVVFIRHWGGAIDRMFVDTALSARTTSQSGKPPFSR